MFRMLDLIVPGQTLALLDEVARVVMEGDNVPDAAGNRSSQNTGPDDGAHD